MRPASRPAHRALAFLHPDLDRQHGEGGLVLSSSGGIELVSGAAAIRQSLLMLLSTLPGERVMRPEYGCELHRLPFSPNDDTTAGLALHHVRQAIARFEPRVKIVELDAGPHPDDPALLEIRLQYRLRATGERSALAFALDLGLDLGGNVR